MTTQDTISSPQPLLTPTVPPSMTRLLLTQTSSATRPPDAGNLAPERMAARSTQITVVLRNILDEQGYRHGGLNE